jgi:hypothetical protein
MDNFNKKIMKISKFGDVRKQFTSWRVKIRKYTKINLISLQQHMWTIDLYFPKNRLWRIFVGVKSQKYFRFNIKTKIGSRATCGNFGYIVCYTVSKN